MRGLVALFVFALPLAASAQQQYAGTLGKQPIHLLVDAYSDGAVQGAYVYDRHDTPIAVNGRLAKGVLQLQEKDGDKAIATLRFDGFTQDATHLRGQWIPVAGGEPLPIVVAKEVDIRYENGPFAPVELLQPASSADHYFKVRVARIDDRWPRVVAVDVFRKREDTLVQRLEVDTDFRGLHGLETGDFNFDGVTDFSLFEASGAGPNTSSLYFLRDPGTGRYVLSRISGTSLWFDAESKTVHEHNQCCAGRSHMSATYRVVADRLELIERSCFELSEVGDAVDVPCGEDAVEEDRE
jgi:hypothetical protein